MSPAQIIAARERLAEIERDGREAEEHLVNHARACAECHIDTGGCARWCPRGLSIFAAVLGNAGDLFELSGLIWGASLGGEA